ncbi:MAG TPA: acyltransferase [Burkholderiales bacterium]|nr:acyltransferase [Burkholderiales bacterium]
MTYLPGLTGLRFFAAFTVLIAHLRQFQVWLGYPPPGELFGEGMASQGVWFFFVLSGFLITHLLLREIDQTGGISIRDFYLRRVLRIWPIYYVMVFLALVVVAPAGITVASHFTAVDGAFWARLALYLLFLPQLATNLYPHVAGASHLWSIGVEEMFYLLWPLLLLGTYRRLWLAIIPIMALALVGDTRYSPEWLVKICFDFDLYAFFLLGAGALAAWLARYQPHRLAGTFNIYAQAGAYLIVLANLAFTPPHYRFMLPVYAFGFVLVIVNVSMNPKTLFRFEHPALKFLGDISYGIYVYQFLSILAVAKLLEAASIQSAALLYAGSIVLTLLVAALSHRYIERPFLHLRHKFRRPAANVDLAPQKA